VDPVAAWDLSLDVPALDDTVPDHLRKAATADSVARRGRAITTSLKGVDPHLVSLIAPDSPEAEQYRALRHAVEQKHVTGTGTVVAVCSPGPGDGKTTTSINLAGALAQDPKAWVLLIEIDLRRPAVTLADHLALGDVGKERGLVDAILDSSINLEEVVRYLPQYNLAVLPAGRPANAPYEALKSARLGELLRQAAERFDYVVLDAPPVVPVPDCRLIAKWVNGFVVVVAADRTPREALEESLAALGAAKVMGLVFNRHQRSATGGYGYGYGYGYGSRRTRSNWWTRLWEP
jgi:capsular exopolysaccharide synthesis family protein